MAIDGRTKAGKEAKAALAAQAEKSEAPVVEESVEEAVKAPVVVDPPVEAPAPEAPATDMEDMKAQVSLLMRALAAERVPVEKDVTPVCLVKTGGDSLSIFLMDDHGNQRQFTWDDPGEQNYLTPEQWEEMKDHPGGRKFLDRGYVTIESDVTAALLDTARWIRDMDIQDVDAAVTKISDVQHMVAIINHIERERVVTEDRDGRTLVDKEGAPRAEFKKLDSKTRVLFETLAGKVFDISGAKYTLNDG